MTESWQKPPHLEHIHHETKLVERATSLSCSWCYNVTSIHVLGIICGMPSWWIKICHTLFSRIEQISPQAETFMFTMQSCIKQIWFWIIRRILAKKCLYVHAIYPLAGSHCQQCRSVARNHDRGTQVTLSREKGQTAGSHEAEGQVAFQGWSTKCDVVTWTPQSWVLAFMP